MDPSQALAETNTTAIERRSTATAPEAANWLNHPAQPESRPSLAQRLAAEPPWVDEESQ